MSAKFIALAVVLGSWSAAAAACEDVVFGLDSGMRQPSSLGEKFIRDVALFELRGLTLWNVPSAVLIEPDQWTVDCESTTLEIAADFRSAVDSIDGTLDPRRLREIFAARFNGSIASRGHQDVVAPTLAALAASTGFAAWTREVVPRSMVKRKTRVIYRSPPEYPFELSVSQTLESETGDLAAPVLETEVAVIRQDGSGDWDFYAYDAQGALANFSTFPAGPRPSPDICLNCHYDPSTRTVSRLLRR